MDELENELRTLFERKAGTVPGRAADGRTVPAKMLSRARRRIAATAAGAIVALGVAGFGVIQGVHALSGPSKVPPADHRPAVHACRSVDLRGLNVLDGAAGSRAGTLEVTNRSAATCTLSGRPPLGLANADGASLALQQVPTEPFWKVNGSPAPQGWPVVRLRPGERASIRARWSNWCGAEIPATITIEVAQGGTVSLPAGDPPPCLAPSSGSTLEVGPFEPPSS